jgi:hypothetical protein
MYTSTDPSWKMEGEQLAVPDTGTTLHLPVAQALMPVLLSVLLRYSRQRVGFSIVAVILVESVNPISIFIFPIFLLSGYCLSSQTLLS